MESVTFKSFNTMRSKLIVCLWILLTNGVFGAEADETKTEVSKVEGESVTLHTGVEEYHLISWMLGPEDSNVAKCRGNTDGTRSCEITYERFRDRLKTDNQTGSLSIINISTELAGLYKLQIFDKAFKKSYKEFSVTVSEAGLEPDHTQLKWGLGLLGLLGLGLGLLVLVGVVIRCCCCRKAGGNGDVYQYVKNGGKSHLNQLLQDSEAQTGVLM